MNYRELKEKIENGDVDSELVDEIIAINDEEQRVNLAKGLNSQIYLKIIAKTVNDLNLRMILIEELYSVYDKLEAVEDVNDTESILKIISIIDNRAVRDHGIP